MAAFNKFNDFVEQVGKGVHLLHAAGHTLKMYLSNEQPLAADTVKADIAEIATGNGYTGPIDIENDWSETGGTASCTVVDKTVTAAGGTVGPFRYVVIYNEDPTSPADPLVGWYDYGTPITLNDGESFTTDFGASLFTLA